MKTLKMLLVAFAITMSSAANADPNLKFVDGKSLSCEVESFLEQHQETFGKEVEVVLFFSVSEDRKIQSLAVASPHETVNTSVFGMLENCELTGEFWRLGKIYEIRIIKQPELKITNTGNKVFECSAKG